jgi:hypothetical protein
VIYYPGSYAVLLYGTRSCIACRQAVQAVPVQYRFQYSTAVLLYGTAVYCCTVQLYLSRRVGSTVLVKAAHVRRPGARGAGARVGRWRCALPWAGLVLLPGCQAPGIIIVIHACEF